MSSWQERDREREQAYGDAAYEAWREGKNPDRVSRDSVDDFYYDTYDPSMAASMEVDRLHQEDIRARQRAEDEMADVEQPYPEPPQPEGSNP